MSRVTPSSLGRGTALCSSSQWPSMDDEIRSARARSSQRYDRYGSRRPHQLTELCIQRRLHEPARYWTTRFSPSSAKTNALVPTVAAVTRLARGDERYPPAFESPARARGSPSGNGCHSIADR